MSERVSVSVTVLQLLPPLHLTLVLHLDPLHLLQLCPLHTRYVAHVETFSPVVPVEILL